MSLIPQNTNLILVDTRAISKTFILPSVKENPGRILVIKDYYGASSNSTITITTQGSDLIDDYNTNYTFSNAYGTLTFISDGFASWRMTGLYSGALSFASATNPVYLIPAGTTAVLTYVSPLACQFTITFGANTVRCNYYVSITPTLTADANPVSGLTLSSGIISSFGNFIINATYYVIVIPYDAAGLAGPQIVSPGKVCVNFPSPPINLGLSINATTGIASVSWTAGLNATSYSWTMYRGTTNDYTTGTVFSRGATASTSFTTQIDGSGYFYYTVYSINLVGTSSQVVSNPAPSAYFNQVNTYTYTGANQTFTAPTGVTSVTVHLWGAGGGAHNNAGSTNNNGGAGAYVSGTLAITPGSSYTVITAGGGGFNDSPGGFGGGATTYNNYSNPQGGGGGGRSAIRNVANTADLVDAGGGGGGGGGFTESFGGGAAYWNGTSQAGQGPYAGQGGSQGGGGSSGGQGLVGAFGFNSGGLYQGCTNNNEYAGAGGGGFYGGGGGGANNPRGSGPPGTSSGGGGGSSYTGGISNATGANSPDYYTAPGQNITYYQGTVARGGLGTLAAANGNGYGSNGLVVIVIGSPPPLAPKNLTFVVSNGTGTLSWSTYIGGASAFTWTLYQNTTTQYTGTVYSTGSTASTTTTTAVPTGYYYYVTVSATVSGTESYFATSSIVLSSLTIRLYIVTADSNMSGATAATYIQTAKTNMGLSVPLTITATSSNASTENGSTISKANYDVVLLWSNSFFSDSAFGSALNNFIAAGGCVIKSTFCFNQPLPGYTYTNGAFTYTGVQNNQTSMTSYTLNITHPITTNVGTTFTISNTIDNGSVTLNSGASTIATASSGRPLIGINTIGTARQVDFNTYLGYSLADSTGNMPKLVCRAIYWCMGFI